LHFIGRHIERNKILDALGSNPQYSKEIINIYGIGGVGKTTLLNKILEDFSTGNEQIVYFKSNEDLKYDNLPTFVSKLSKIISSNHLKIDKDFKKLDKIVSEYLSGIGEIKVQLSKEDIADLAKLYNEVNKAINRSKGKRKLSGPKIKLGNLQLGNYEIGVAEINLFETTEPEIDNKFAYEEKKKQYEEKEQQLIDSKINSPYIKDLVKNPNRQITSAFVNGLMESIYPRFIIRKNYFKKPIKLLMIIDTYEKVSDDVNDWILELFDEMSKHKEYYDFRLVISGRESLRLSDNLSRWDKFQKILFEKDLKRFDSEEILEFMKMESINKDQYDILLNDTDGLPILVDMWCKNYTLGSSGCNFLLMEDRIFWWKNEKQKEWIRASAFLDNINIDGLRVYFQNDADEAFDYLKNCHEACRPNEKSPEEWMLHPIIKKVLLKSTKQKSPTLYGEYDHKAKLFKNIVLSFPDVIKRAKMLNLALFNHFNQTAYSCISEVDSFSINDFVNENISYFNKNKYSYTLKSEYRGPLLEYYNSINSGEVKHKLELISTKWKEKEKELSKILHNKETEYNDLKIKIDNLEFELIKNSNDLIQSRNQCNSFKVTKDLEMKDSENSTWKVQKLPITIIIFILIFIALNIFLFNSNIYIFIACSFSLIFSIILFYRKHNSNNSYYKDVLSTNPENESEKLVKLLESNIQEIKTQISKNQKNLESLNLEIISHKDLLSENYIYVE